jgi:L-ascorbate metabolism protein UlaG (beta-lactamase superfamily)
MEITYLGHSSFKIKTSTAVVVTDPFDPDYLGLKYPKIDGDIVTVSHQHKDHNAIEFVTNTKKVIYGPGEYEVMSVSIFGYPAFHDTKNGSDRGKNTIYVIEADGLRLVHLGDLGHILSDDQVNLLEEVDILFVPVGGFYTIGSKEAVEVVSSIEPKIVIPMHYKQDGMNSEISSQLVAVDEFISASGLPRENCTKLTIKAGSLSDETKAVVFEIK